MMYPTFLCEFEVVVVDVLLALLDEDAMFKGQNDLNSECAKRVLRAHKICRWY